MLHIICMALNLNLDIVRGTSQSLHDDNFDDNI